MSPTLPVAAVRNIEVVSWAALLSCLGPDIIVMLGYLVIIYRYNIILNMISHLMAGVVGFCEV